MAQLLLKKPVQEAKEQKTVFIVCDSVELQIPKPEVSRPQAKPQAKPKKDLLRLFKKGKNNAKYLEELVNINRLNAKLDARANYAPRHINY